MFNYDFIFSLIVNTVKKMAEKAETVVCNYNERRRAFPQPATINYQPPPLYNLPPNLLLSFVATSSNNKNNNNNNIV